MFNLLVKVGIIYNNVSMFSTTLGETLPDDFFAALRMCHL